jgi:hypothetical protein
MLEEAALPPSPVQGPAPWKVSAGLAISSLPNGVDMPAFHVEPTSPDPMQVEEEACLTVVDICLSGPNGCGSGQISPRPSLLEPEEHGGSPPPVQVDHQIGLVGDGPGTPAVDGRALVVTASTSTNDFIAAFKKPLSMPILSSPPRLRRTRVARARAGELDDSELVPKRSIRLVAKSRYREPKLEAQARKVMMKKLGLEVETQLPDEASFDEF